MNIININLSNKIVLPAILFIILFKIYGSGNWGGNDHQAQSTEKIQKRIALLEMLPKLSEKQKIEYTKLQNVLEERAANGAVPDKLLRSASMYSTIAFLAAIALVLLMARPQDGFEHKPIRNVARSDVGAWLPNTPVRGMLANFSVDSIEIKGSEVRIQRSMQFKLLASIFVLYGISNLVIKILNGSPSTFYLLPASFAAVGVFMVYLSLHTTRISKIDSKCEHGALSKKVFTPMCAQAFSIKSAGMKNGFRFTRTQIVLEGEDGRAILATVGSEDEVSEVLEFLDLPLVR